LDAYLGFLKNLRPDGLIVSDPGIVMSAREQAPEMPLHLSTQASTTNSRAAAFWKNMGIKRINVARELSLDEIKTISETVSMEIEAFVHGAMCISYSGRCLLSSFMENRDANRGMCCHPCRFSYAVVEAKRPGQYYPLAEDPRGSYIFNSRDLCMIEHLPAMVDAGITSLKIEGRMKGIHYLASVVKVYRAAIDALLADPVDYTVEPWWIDELNQVGTRGYGTGFYLGDTDNTRPNYAGNQPGNNRFLAKVVASKNANQVRAEVRNKLFRGDDVEIITPGKPNLKDRIRVIHNADGLPIAFAQPGSLVTLTFHRSYNPNDLIRKVFP
jgi:putative protease